VAESSARVWKKIGVYYALTMLFSGVFDMFVVHAGRMQAGNLLYVTGSMWSPGLAVLLTKIFFGESIRDLPWRWGDSRNAWAAYFLPIAYALPVYFIVWLAGLGAFNWPFLSKVAQDFGWGSLSQGATLTLFLIFTGTLGMVGKISRALGEEIGWRGFLVPELAKVVRFPSIGLISGIMWSAYHYPILLFGDYNAGTAPWFGLSCFTLAVVAESFIFAWLTLKSRSLWPAAIMHASHNLFIQSIFTPLTRDTGPTRYLIDEFGIGLVVTTAIAATLICWRRGQVWPNESLTAQP
jgi:membrane protease YdiL (CAAX protease family)